jgi:type IV secretion system protein VirB4
MRHEDPDAESRRFLVKQGHESVVVELDLHGMDDQLAVLSGRSSTVAILDEIRAELGDDPAIWLPEFHRRRKATGAR